jgi:hypothetical protein
VSATTQVITADLGGERLIRVEARRTGSAEADVKIGEILSFQGVVDSIQAVSDSVARAIEHAKPDSASVEFGVDVGVEAGQLTSLLVKGSGTATLTITLSGGK